jgi:transposase-like protein
MPRKFYADEVKAAAIADVIAGGLSPYQVAAARGVPRSTLRKWVEAALKGQGAPPLTREMLDEAIWALIFDYIAAIRAVAHQAQDKAWLRRQDAHALAIYAGVHADKLLRVLGGLQDAAERRAQERAALAASAGEPLQSWPEPAGTSSLP